MIDFGGARVGAATRGRGRGTRERPGGSWSEAAAAVRGGNGIPDAGYARRWAMVGVAGWVVAASVGCGTDRPPVPDPTPTTATMVGLASSAAAMSPLATPMPQPSPTSAPEPTAEPAPVTPSAIAPEEPIGPVGPPVAPTVGGSGAPFRSETAEIGPVVWSTAIDGETNAPVAPVEVVPVGAPAIYATLPVTRVQRGASLGATWTYNGTPLPTLGGAVVANREQVGGWVEFHIARAEDAVWPAGVYAVVVTVDGRLAQESAVRVGAPSTAVG